MIHFPRRSDGIRLTSFEWQPICYRNVIGVLMNMCYAGVYAYGKTGRPAKIRNGRAHVTYKNRKSREDCDVVIRGRHVGYIEWEEYERDQVQLDKNAFGRAGGIKSGRGGGALLAGLLCCARCGRRLHVVYTGITPRPVYRCDNPNLLLGQKRWEEALGRVRSFEQRLHSDIAAVPEVGVTRLEGLAEDLEAAWIHVGR